MSISIRVRRKYDVRIQQDVGIRATGFVIYSVTFRSRGASTSDSNFWCMFPSPVVTNHQKCSKCRLAECKQHCACRSAGRRAHSLLYISMVRKDIHNSVHWPGRFPSNYIVLIYVTASCTRNVLQMYCKKRMRIKTRPSSARRRPLINVVHAFHLPPVPVALS